jgi:restriction system protein
MLGGFEGATGDIERWLALLAPVRESVPAAFNNVLVDVEQYRRVWRKIQQFRANAGPGQGDRHGNESGSPGDDAWHLVIFDQVERVAGSGWFRRHRPRPGLRDLETGTSVLARDSHWRDPFRQAIEQELARSRGERLPFGEVGGWSIRPSDSDRGPEMLLAAATYGLLGVLGGALAIATLPARSTALRRLGADSLESGGIVIPPYFDPDLGREMEVLRIDSRRPSAKFAPWVDRLSYRLPNVKVLTNALDVAAASAWSLPVPHLEVAARDLIRDITRIEEEPELSQRVDEPTSLTLPPDLLLQASVVTFGGSVADGQLVTGLAIPWKEIVRQIERDPAFMHRVPWRKWEEILAGAYEREGWTEVILTPRSGDRGRDIIATRPGVGSIRIIDQMKAYKPGHLVTADDVRSMLGVLQTERNVSKGVVTTTSGFAPGILQDENIKAFIPYRLALVDGNGLLEILRRARLRA